MIKFLLDYSSGIPIYRQIIDQIRFGIASGQLKLGEQLPTVRALAVELKVNLNTVSKAYKELDITQTGLRDTIGKHELSDLLQERDKIAEDLQQVLDRNTNPWGITCQTVGIKDIAIPQDLAEAMSKEAQAERERRARVILGTAETEIAEKFEQASKKYTDNPVALHLRGMNMLFEGLKEKGSMVIVPSSALDTMNLGAMGGLVSLAKNNETPK